jgi:hypothetical protein
MNNDLMPLNVPKDALIGCGGTPVVVFFSQAVQ